MNNYSRALNTHCFAHRPLSPVHCTSSIEHCALCLVPFILCRVHRTLNIARRPPVLVLRAWFDVQRTLHRGQSSSHGKRKTAPQWAPFFVSSCYFHLFFAFLPLFAGSSTGCSSFCGSNAAASASSLASSARNFSILAF